MSTRLSTDGVERLPLAALEPGDRLHLLGEEEPKARKERETRPLCLFHRPPR